MKHTTNFFTFLVIIFCLLVMPVSAFEDDFDDGDITDWALVGVWTVESGGMPSGSVNYTQTTTMSANLKKTIASIEPNYMSIWANCAINAHMTFHFSSTQYFYIDYDGTNTLTFVQPSGSTTIGTVAHGVWNKFTVTRSGSNFIIQAFDNSETELYNIVVSADTGQALTTEAEIDRVGGAGTTKFDDYKLLQVAPSATNSINWNYDMYTVHDTGVLSWVISESSWTSFIYQYRVNILHDGDSVHTIDVGQTGNYYYDFEETGGYTAQLQSKLYVIGTWVSLDADSCNVIPKVDSYISVPQTAPQRTNFTVNYLYGTTPPAAAISVKKLDEQLEGYVPYDVVYLDGGTANTVYSQNMSIWGEGFYKLVLYNANVPEADLKTDVIQITKIIIPPQTRINTSRIRSQLDTYSVSDMVWGDYAVDFTNYTSYVINLEMYNYEYDAVVYSETVNDQCGVILIPLYDPDLTIFTGEHNVRLSSYSNTGVFVDDIVHDNFTINLVNPLGYGLTLSKYEVYSDETFVIKCIVPQPSTLKIINRLTLDEIDEFEVNASSYINYQISEIGNYEIRLIDGSGYIEGNQYIKVVEGTVIDDPVVEDEIEDDAIAFDTKFELMLSSGAFVALLIIIACVGAFGKIGGVVGVFLGMVVGISISFLMGYLPAWILFIMVLALCVVFVSKLINSFGGGE